MPKRVAAGLFALVVAAYGSALRFPFLSWDDRVNVVDNDLLRFDWSGLSFMLTGSKLGHWQPATWLSLAFDRLLWGDNAFGFHLTNVLLHATAAVLLFYLARRLKLGGPDKSDFPAAFAALFWALHPLRVESVAWVTERRDVLCGVLALAAALAYVRGWRRRALALTVLAMTAKVFAIVLPAVWLLLDVRLDGKPRWKEKLPCIPFVLFVLGVNVAAQAGSGASVPLANFGITHRLAQAFYGLAFYPWKTLFPQGLAPLYERSILLEPFPFSVALAAVSSVVILLAVTRERLDGLTQAALAYSILLLPALGLFKSGRMVAADRWSYLPAIPLSLLAAAALNRALEPRVFRAAATGVLLALLATTFAQLPVWSSDEALWARAAEASPLSWFALERLAEAEANAGKTNQALSRLHESKTLHAFVNDLSARLR